jgi:hypothetical protein
MTVLATGAPAGTARYSLLITSEPDLVRAAQRLRYRVFADEMGAELRTDVPGVDVDELDSICDHLIISEDTSGDVVGTYRMLPPGRSDRLYSDAEFDLTPLAALRAAGGAGRSCVPGPPHRCGDQPDVGRDSPLSAPAGTSVAGRLRLGADRRRRRRVASAPAAAGPAAVAGHPAPAMPDHPNRHFDIDRRFEFDRRFDVGRFVDVGHLVALGRRTHAAAAEGVSAPGCVGVRPGGLRR